MDLFGKQPDVLQTGISVEGNSITGTLKYVTDYTGFNDSVVEEQSGNYLAIKVDTVDEVDSITVELVGGTKGPVTLDEDRIHVMRIKDVESQSIKIVATKGEESCSETFDISGLTLEPGA